MNPLDDHDLDDVVLEKSIERYQSMIRKKKADEPSVRSLVAQETLLKAMPSDIARRLSIGEPGATIVQVPGKDWIARVVEAVEALNEDIHVLAKLDGKPSEEESATTSRRLAEGAAVVAVTANLAALPPLFGSICDTTVVLTANTAAAAAVIRKVAGSGSVSAIFRKLDISVLSFDELCGLIVAGANARTICDRIGKAVRVKVQMARKGEVLPNMEAAVEWGAAREWAMALKRDLEDIREHGLSPKLAQGGLVLHGPPGTGKTLWARTLGEYLGLPVVLGSMGDFFAGGAGYLDSVLKAQRALFDKARMSSPCVLFIDEICSMPNIETMDNRARDWWTPIINDFLTLLDGAGADRTGIIVIGATNRLHGVSPSLLRPGRLDGSIYLGPPNAEGVERVLRHHLNGDLLHTDLAWLADMCAARSFTSAVLMDFVRAAKRTARHQRRELLLDDLVSAVFPPDDLSDEDRKRIEIHEAGHAVMGQLLVPELLHSVSTFSGQSETIGAATTFDLSARRIETKKDIENRIRVLLSGMCAEKLATGQSSSGSGGSATSDLAMATSLLSQAFVSLGLGSKLTWRCPPEDALGAIALDPVLRQEIEGELQRLYRETEALLEKHLPQVQAVAAALADKRYMSAADVASIFEDMHVKAA